MSTTVSHPAGDAHKAPDPPHRIPTWLKVCSVITLILQGSLLFVAFFEPALPYIVSNPREDSVDSEQFFKTLAALTEAYVATDSIIQVLPNGENYYPAELQAIRSATKTISLEAYIFEDGKVGPQFIDALAERARAGVKVNVVLDAVGSTGLSKSQINRLTSAGGHFAWYMPLRWYSWTQLNDRTHRELLIVDGRIGFIGGSGWADHWLYPEGKNKNRWRDTMVRVEGSAVTGLQAAFSENWLEASGKVNTGKDYFPFQNKTGDATALIVPSSRTTGRSTRARVLFHVLVAAAKKRIHISTPYFLPDASLSDELVRAIDRGVEVKILTPGALTDHALTRRSSRRLMGPLLKAGAGIWEYQGSMLHAKVMLIDDLWAVVGSTNMDSRSFRLNDEVNLATPNANVVGKLETDFQGDLQRGTKVRYEEWRHRGIAERIHELFGSLFQRQE